MRAEAWRVLARRTVIACLGSAAIGCSDGPQDGKLHV